MIEIVQCSTRIYIQPILSSVQHLCYAVQDLQENIITHLIHREDNTASNLSLAYVFIYRSNVRQLLRSVMALHVASGCDVDRLDCVLTIPHVGAVDGYTLEHGEENGRVESGFRRQADCHEMTVGPQVVDGLGVS
jgi:hypothetical protein